MTLLNALSPGARGLSLRARTTEDVLRSMDVQHNVLAGMLDPVISQQLQRTLGAGLGAPGAVEMPAYQPVAFSPVAPAGLAPTGALGMGNFVELLMRSLGGMRASPMGADLFGGGMNGMGFAVTMLAQAVAAQRRLEASALGLPAVSHEPPMLTSAPSSTFAAALPADKKEVAKALNVSGKKDVDTINKAVGELASARAKPAAAQPGDKTGPGKLVLSAEDVEKVRNAPDAATAKQELAKIIARQTGVDVDAPNMGDKKSIKNKKYREAMNALTGKTVKNGPEKNSGSAMLFDALLESTVSAIKTSQPASSTYATSGLRNTGVAGLTAGPQMQVPGQLGAMTVDVTDYNTPAETVGELASPLIFDLTGNGLKIRTANHVKLDLDGDGREEVITDLERGMGLLVFDSRYDGGGKDLGAGRDMFGDGTDLSAYGIGGPREDGTFNNGFEALRALCEHLGRVGGTKQHLDASDLAFLEQHCGLRMRTDGVAGTADKRFSELGISRINLGRADGIQPLERAEEDAFGNRLMRQAGATFVVRGQPREYVDIWFNVQARTQAKPESVKMPAGVVSQAAQPARRLTMVRG